jgi:hypothetical protein
VNYLYDSYGIPTFQTAELFVSRIWWGEKSCSADMFVKLHLAFCSDLCPQKSLDKPRSFLVSDSVLVYLALLPSTLPTDTFVYTSTVLNPDARTQTLQFSTHRQSPCSPTSTRPPPPPTPSPSAGRRRRPLRPPSSRPRCALGLRGVPPRSLSPPPPRPPSRRRCSRAPCWSGPVDSASTTRSSTSGSPGPRATPSFPTVGNGFDSCWFGPGMRRGVLRFSRSVWCAEIGGEDGAGDSDLGFSKWADELRGGASGFVQFQIFT